MIKKYISFGFLILLCANVSFAQKFDIKKLSTNEGLPSGQIADVVQDREGYIWLSTYDGVIRYDGIETKVYTAKNGLRNNYIYDLFIDSSERFWISTEGMGVGYLQEDSVYYPEEFAVLDTLTVTYITESQDNRLWFSTYTEGVFIWDGEGFEQLTEEEGLPSNTVWNIRFDEEGEAWIATFGGIGIYNGSSLRVIHSENGLSGSAAYSFAEEMDGTVWVSTNSGITKYDGENWEQIHEINGKELGYIYDVFVDREGLVWIATERDGIYWFDGETYTHINKKNGLSSNYIYSLNEDNEGRIWVATDENGVNIFRNKNFRIYESEFVGGESVHIIYEKGTDLWAGTDEGLTKFRENGPSIHYQLPEDLARYNEVWDIDELPNGNLLILNSNAKLFEFDGNNFSDFDIDINLTQGNVYDIIVDDDIIWLASESGLLKYQNGALHNFTTADGMHDDFVLSLYEDQEGFIWAVSDQGLSKIGADSVIVFSLGDDIAGSSVSLITQSQDGNYWVGTNTGFTRLEMDENNRLVHITNFKLAEEFLQEALFLQFDEGGNLWLGTSGGIHFFDRGKLKSNEGGVIDGIFMPLQDFGKGMEMNYLASLLDDEGNLWFGSYMHGLIKYSSGKRPAVHKAPKPFLRDLTVNDELVNVKDFQEGRFKYDQNNISIRFGSFNYEDPSRVYFKYRLSGFQDSWERVYGKTEVTYTNLPPGSYHFELSSKSIQSEWGEAVRLASFQISKPFWQTNWFYILLVLAVVGISGSIIKMLLVYFEKRKLADLVDERTEELKKALGEKNILIKEIHHRVKNNMAVVSGLLELQGWKMKDSEAKMVIETSKLRIQTMASIHEKLYQNENFAHIEFGQFAEDLVSKVSGSLKGVEKEIKVHLDIDPIHLNVNVAIPCGLILNEALSNSYEHAFNQEKQGNVYISFKETGGDFELVIIDDGIGVPENIINSVRSSLGITLINSLAEQIKGKAQIVNDNGTCIKIRFPQQR